MEKRNKKSKASLTVTLCVMIVIAIFASPCVGTEDPDKFPSKPITLIMPWAAGGMSDTTGRTLATVASKTLGQQIVVENKPGAGGVIGTSIFSKAAPDGYTIGWGTCTPSVIAPHLRPVPYKTKEDFTFIMQLIEQTSIFTVLTDSHINTFNEFIEEARKNPGKLNYATGGPLTTQHIFMELIFSIEKVKVTHVPTGGGAEASAQLLGRHLDAIYTTEMGPHLRTGRVRGLGVQANKRIKFFPDIPTFFELGYKQSTPTWIGLAGPRGLNPRIVKKIYDAFKKAYEDPSFIALCETVNSVPAIKDQEMFTAMVLKEFDEQGKILRELGFVK